MPTMSENKKAGKADTFLSWTLGVLACLWVAWGCGIGPMYWFGTGLADFGWANVLYMAIAFVVSFAILWSLVRYGRGERVLPTYFSRRYVKLCQEVSGTPTTVLGIMLRHLSDAAHSRPGRAIHAVIVWIGRKLTRCTDCWWKLMLLFVIVQKMGIGGENGVFGWITLLIAHITFNVPYVIFNVGPKLRQLDGSLYNAALDLGCTPRQAFFKVILPEISPAILSAFLICLTYSIDDFMISYFNCGTVETLPIAIYSMTRKKVSPEIYALSTIMFVVILCIILVSNAMESRSYRRDQKALRGEGV